MAEKDLEKEWGKMEKKLFEEFIQKNVGLRGPKPACYGTHDNKSYCIQCGYRNMC